MDETTLDELFARLWDDYTAINPQARAIHDLLAARSETVINDHIALRTFDDRRVSIDVLARAFVERGYRHAGSYRFASKKLAARHYQHVDPARPKVFISELELAAFSEALRATVTRLVDEIPAGLTGRDEFVASGRHWRITWDEYEALRAESEYAAWMAAFGFRANHFTVSVNDLRTFAGLADLNRFLVCHGFELNLAGGAIKGSAEQLLEQSSTRAAPVRVELGDRSYEIPGCYYEFALRHPGPDGALFQGFVAESADRIFESTDRG